MKLTFSYASLVMVTGMLLLGTVWLFLLRYVPDRAMLLDASDAARLHGGVFPVRSRLLSVFAPRGAGVLGVLLIVGLVGGWLLAGRVLAPLSRITGATRLAGTGSLSHRIALPGRHDELRELADAFDSMLARLEHHDAQLQRFAANASHELRTPLAATQTLLDVAGRDETGDAPLLDRLRVLNTRAIDVTEALLLLSRADQRSFPRVAVDLSLLAEEAIETLLFAAEERHVTIEAVTDAAPTFGSPALLGQLCVNVVHNAIVHNVALGATVWVTTAAAGNGDVALVVENTGPEIDDRRLATLTEPFVRGERRVAGDRVGVGLGLAIVQSITAAHDGTLRIERRVGGGLRVEVRLRRTDHDDVH